MDTTIAAPRLIIAELTQLNLAASIACDCMHARSRSNKMTWPTNKSSFL